jgi:hypothetical protein
MTSTTMMRLLSFFLVAFASIPSNSAFVIPWTHPAVFTATHRTTTTVLPPRSLTVVSSAKILPIAYTSAAAALLEKAITKSSTKVQVAVLLATSALSLVNFGPSDNAKLASAKQAYKNTPPATSGVAKQKRQAAITWRSVVRIKLVGQLLGLIWMVRANTFAGVMRGAATIMAASVAYFLCGAGRSRHDDQGNWDPMPSNKAIIIPLVLMGVALAGAGAPVESTKHAVLCGVFAAGTAVGALEGMPKFLQTIGVGKK